MRQNDEEAYAWSTRKKKYGVESGMEKANVYKNGKGSLYILISAWQ